MKAALPATLIVATAFLLTGCGGDATPAIDSTTQTPATSATTAVPKTPLGKDAATASAIQIQALVPSAVNVVTITAQNDPNPLFGKPGAYLSAAVIYEKVNQCTTLVVACGAKVEVYKSEADAAARTKYLLGMKKAGMIPGGEYDYLSGLAVLRVFGGVKASVAEDYHVAFGGELAKAGPTTGAAHPTS